VYTQPYGTTDKRNYFNNNLTIDASKQHYGRRQV
jgi:hypothetical protein